MLQNNIRVLLVKPQNNLWFPVGYAYLAASWKQAGIQFDFVDLDKDNLDTVYFCLKRQRYTAICAGGLIPSYKNIRDIMSLAKRFAPHLARVVGGPLVANIPIHYIFNDLNAHFAVFGEGEVSSVLLLEHIARNGIGVCDIPGVYSPVDKNINNRVYEKPDINNLPIPDYSFFDFNFHKTRSASISYDLWPILSGRGCHGSCAFCSPPHGKYRSRNPKDVVYEISKVSEKYAINKIFFSDEMFFDSVEKIKIFCNEYKKIGCPLPWQCHMRVDGPLDALPLMREHGCTHIAFGFESTSNRALSLMNKRTTHEMQIAAINKAEESGIIWLALWMAGNYKETHKELISNFNFFRKRHQTLPAVLITYPGTLNWIRAQKENLIKDELFYIENLENLFVGPLFYRISKMISQELPYLNITDMSDSCFWQTYLEHISLQIQEMEITDFIFRDNTIEGQCPSCGHCVKIPYNEEQPFNLHITSCPHCRPLWLHISPLRIEHFRSHIVSKTLQLHNKRNIAVLDDSEHSAAFFLMKNYLHLDWNNLSFIRTEGFTLNSVLGRPVYSLESLHSYHIDAVLIIAHTQRVKSVLQKLHTLNLNIEYINCTLQPSFF